MKQRQYILRLVALLIVIISIVTGECKASTALYSPLDGDLSSIAYDSERIQKSTSRDTLPRRAKDATRAKRDSINVSEAQYWADSLSNQAERLKQKSPNEFHNDSITNDTTIVHNESDYIDFLPTDTMGYAPINAEKAYGEKLEAVEIPQQRFIPNPTRALWLAAVFPGAGQIYNRKYWKLPIFYGGFLGCTYALLWNQQMYTDYSQAYLDIMDDNPNTNTHLEMLPPRYDITGREEHFKKIFKNKKNFYRRNRDLSAFCFIGVYLLSVVDAYVDAHLSIFDISPDLSLQLQPAVIENKSTHTNHSYGVGCSFKF